ncbi:hypothetical protein EJF36_01235 [Bacillus sp. HMF5848]|uniref:hypothetical protein n=1 Tax=Bacillus sp. HMF5848 TaxID=2495421 RepID=UPI000F79089E|nr:hypothetical protein [Bacillus sp. HMF5848]RSK25644.1 hypothetical protein EJF36_01235 [Bacillus sp. HMF5848]
MRKLWFIFVGFLILASACSDSYVTIGSVGHSNGKEMEYKYHYFNGKRQQLFHMKAGTVIELSYDLVVEKGDLSLVVKQRDGQIVWERSFQKNDRGTTSVTIAEPGYYNIIVEGNKTKGNFKIEYEEL